ncbi:MAG: hypothetical protein CSA20_04655 [Deltaproteobacteria bacterium]|nr:MAG: hypothetical protein CSB23_03295 [Deltaproteobacteria bacterium]PIE73367.1 MAG: hypothetical protein CSA20_04655 [Deltaproteobacteria bacterium]
MDTNSLLIVLSIHALALILPGPDFVIVTKLSAVNGRKSGIIAALGISTAIGFYVFVCALGVSVVLSALPFLSTLITYAGTIYLSWLGIKCLFSKGEILTQTVQINKSKAYLTGFLTNILNPKAMLYFGSVLPQVLKPHASTSETAAVLLLLCLESFLWFSCVAFVFSSSSVLSWLKGRLVWFERVIGIILISLAVKLAVSTRR